MKRVKVQAVILLLALLLLSACGIEPTPTQVPEIRPSPVVGTGSGDIKIGLIGPLTGPNAAYGTAMRRGILMALEDIKASGGIGGRKIALIERDDQANPDIAKANFLDLVEKERVVALIGTVNDEVGMVQAPLANQWQIPWVIPVATGQKLVQPNSSGPNYIFRLAVPDVEQATFIISFLQGRSSNQIALVADNSKNGQDGAKLLTPLLQNAGIQVVFDDTFYPEDTPENHKSYITALKDAKPSIIFFWGSLGAVNQLRTVMTDENYTVPIIGTDSLAVLGFGKQLPPTFANVFVPQTFLLDNPGTQQQDFIARYKRQFNTDQIDFPGGMAQSYDAMRLLGEGLKQTGAADNRDKLRDALENLGTYDGLIKSYTQPWKPGMNHEALSRQDLTLMVWKSGKLVKVSGP